MANLNELKPEDFIKVLEDWINRLCGGCNKKPDADCFQVCAPYSVQKLLALLREKDKEIETLGAELSRYTENVAEMVETARADGYNRALDDLTERLTKYYGVLKGKTVGGSVEFHVRQIAKEIREGENRDAC